MEMWRRGILLACICLAIFATKYASLSPLVAVESVDFDVEPAGETFWTEESRRLLGLDLEEPAAEKRERDILRVSGPAWERLFAGVRAADEGTAGSREWLARVHRSEREYRTVSKTLFFRPGEEPVVEISGKLRAGADPVYLALDRDGSTAYLEATRREYSSDDFHFGSGFSAYPRPPAGFLFPFRKFSLFILLAGLAAYILLPRPKRNPEEIYYPTWRIVLGDFVSFMLFTVFFALPFFIVGGTAQTVPQGWMFCLIFWPLALLGLWLLPISSWYAGYAIRPRADGFLLESDGRTLDVPLSRVAEFRPLVLTAPRWLVWASAAAALGGRGTARVGNSGRALLLAGSAYGGLGLTLDDGSSVFIWVTDAMGTNAVKNSRRLVGMLEAAGIRKVEEPEVIRSVGLPTGKDPSGRLVKRGSEALVWILAGLPVAAMIVFGLVAMF